MSYVVHLLPGVQKTLLKLPVHIQHRVEKALELLSVDPYSGKKLHGEYEDQYTLRVWPYRIIYEIHNQRLVVLVVRIGHRQGVY